MNAHECVCVHARVGGAHLCSRPSAKVVVGGEALPLPPPPRRYHPRRCRRFRQQRAEARWLHTHRPKAKSSARIACGLCTITARWGGLCASHPTPLHISLKCGASPLMSPCVTPPGWAACRSLLRKLKIRSYELCRSHTCAAFQGQTEEHGESYTIMGKCVDINSAVEGIAVAWGK